MLHFTAGNSYRGSVEWLSAEKEQAKASAHVVIGRCRETWADQFVRRGGMLDQLPASIVQLRLPSQQAWHSTWCNKTMFGIELASCGEVREKNGTIVGPNGDWSERITDPGPLVYAAGRIWENFTAAQMQTAIKVVQYYSALSGGFNQQNVIGHEMAQGVKTPERLGCDKRDLGVWVDLPSFRQCVIGAKDPGTFSLQPRQAPDDKLFVKGTGSAAQMDAQASQQLIALGYHMKKPAGARWLDGKTLENTESLRIFQRMMGLKADGILGNLSLAALAERVADRWRTPPSA